MEEWLRAASPIQGFIGFAIGRSIWWDALHDYLDKTRVREDAAATIADNYLHFVTVYEGKLVREGYEPMSAMKMRQSLAQLEQQFLE